MCNHAFVLLSPTQTIPKRNVEIQVCEYLLQCWCQASRARPGPTQARWDCLSCLCTLEEGDDWKNKSMGIRINRRMGNLHWDGREGWYNSVVTEGIPATFRKDMEAPPLEAEFSQPDSCASA